MSEICLGTDDRCGGYWRSSDMRHRQIFLAFSAPLVTLSFDSLFSSPIWGIDFLTPLFLLGIFHLLLFAFSFPFKAVVYTVVFAAFSHFSFVKSLSISSGTMLSINVTAGFCPATFDGIVSRDIRLCLPNFRSFYTSLYKIFTFFVKLSPRSNFYSYVEEVVFFEGLSYAILCYLLKNYYIQI